MIDEFLEELKKSILRISRLSSDGDGMVHMKIRFEKLDYID